jgi:hypothetical protein
MTTPTIITDEAILRALERVLAPVADVVCEMERLRRKEYLTEKEAALLFSLSSATLKTKRTRGGGPDYVKVGNRVLYARKALEAYLEGKRGGIKFQDGGR